MKLRRPVKLSLRRPPKRPRSGKSTLQSRAAAATADDSYDDEEYYDDMEEPNMKLSHAFIVVLILHIIAVGAVFAFNSIKTNKTAGKAPLAQSTTTEKSSSESADAPTQTAQAAQKPPASDGWTGKTHTVAAGDTLTRISTTYGVPVVEIEKANELTSFSMIRVGQVLRIPAAGSKPVAAKPAAEKPSLTPVASTKASATREDFIAATRPAGTKPAETIPAAKAAPATAPATAKPAETTPAKTETAANPEVYVVQKGDNPYSIAKKFHVSYSALISANDIKDATKIQIGQKLKIPAKAN